MTLIRRQPGAVVKRPMVNRPAPKGLEIEQGTGQVSIYDTTWLLIGLPGVGKSTLASGFDGALVLCTSKKEVGRLTVPFILVDSWEKVLEITDELINNKARYADYKYIVIDFVDAVFTLCITAVCEKLGVTHQSDAAYGKGTDTIDGVFKRWVTALVASGYGVVFISHVNQKDVIVPGGMVTKTICSLPVRARMVLFPLVNVIGCLDYKNIKQSNPTTGKGEIIKRRVISFEGNEYIEAKDRDGVLPTEIVLFKDPKKNFNLFKEYYDGVKKR